MSIISMACSTVTPAGNCLGERIEIHDDQIDRLNAKPLQRF